MCHKISPLYILMILIYTLLWPPDKKTGQSVVLGFDVVDIYLNYSENYQLCTYVKVFRWNWIFFFQYKINPSQCRLRSEYVTNKKRKNNKQEAKRARVLIVCVRDIELPVGGMSRRFPWRRLVCVKWRSVYSCMLMLRSASQNGMSGARQNPSKK